MTRVAVLGSGIVGQTLAKGFQRHGYDVKIGTRDAARVAAVAPGTGIPAALPSDAAAWAEMIVLAVPGHAAEEALAAAGAEHLRGKPIIDVTNPLAPAAPEDGVLRVFTGPNDSLMERLQAAVSRRALRQGVQLHRQRVHGESQFSGRAADDVLLRQ